MSHAILDSQDSLLLVIDIQERLVPAIHTPDADAVVKNTALLIQAAALFGVPVVASEQYPRGLGATVPAVASLLPSPPLQKLEFSAWRNAELRALIEGLGRRSVVVTGVEAHVCVLQTALDLLAAGFTVHVAADAVGSRAPQNRATALDLLRQAGAVVTCAETAAFQWCGVAGSDAFKQLSRLVR